MTRKVLVLVVTGRRVVAPLGVIEQGALSCKAGSKRSTSVRKLGSAIFGHAVHGAGSASIQAYRAYMTNWPARAA